jgi:hypothetical protein
VVARLEVLDLGPDLLNNAAELVTKRLSDPRVWNHAVIEVKVGAADAASGYPYDCIARMFNARHGFLVDADPIRSAIIHRAHEPSSSFPLGERPEHFAVALRHL